MNFQTDLVGKPLAACIDELCSAIDNRWLETADDIALSESQSLVIGDKNVIRRGIRVIGGEPTEEELRREADLVRFQAVLRPFFSALQRGELTAEASELSFGLSAPAPQQLRKELWHEHWQLRLFSGQATLIMLDHRDTEQIRYRLGHIRLPSNIDTMVAGIVGQVERAVQKRGPTQLDYPGKNDQFDDAEHLLAIDELLKSKKAKNVNQAITILLSDGKRIIAGSKDDAKRERLRVKFKRHLEMVKSKTGLSVEAINPEMSRNG